MHDDDDPELYPTHNDEHSELPSACGFFYWIDPERDIEKDMLEVDNKDMRRQISVLTKEVEEITRENKVLRKKNEKLTKKLQEAEAQVFDYKMKCLIILVVCIVMWFTKNVVVVPNMRNLKYKKLKLKCLTTK